MKSLSCKARLGILFAAYGTRKMYSSRHSPSAQSFVQVERMALIAVAKAESYIGTRISVPMTVISFYIRNS